MIYVSARADYAVRALLLIASSAGELSATSIAEIEQVSPAYMARTLVELKRAGLLVRTKTGYSLARATTTVTIAEVFSAVGESVMEVNEEKRTGQGRSAAYLTVRPFWDQMRANVLALLDQTTVHDLERSRATLEEAAQQTSPLR